MCKFLSLESLSLKCDAVEIKWPIILFLSLCRIVGHIMPTCGQSKKIRG